MDFETPSHKKRCNNWFCAVIWDDLRRKKEFEKFSKMEHFELALCWNFKLKFQVEISISRALKFQAWNLWKSKENLPSFEANLNQILKYTQCFCYEISMKLSLKFQWNFNEISTKFQDKSEISRLAQCYFEHLENLQGH